MYSDIVYFSSVFAAGLFSFFSPCVVPLLPVYIATFSTMDRLEAVHGLRRKKQVIIKSMLFVFGISTVFILLGFGAGVLGTFLSAQWFKIALGVLVILLGIHQTGVINIPGLQKAKTIHRKRTPHSSYRSTYVLGLVFSFGWTPCIGPILGSILGLSSTSGDIVYSVILMVVYALGFMIPFMILAIFADALLVKIKGVQRHLQAIKVAGGILIIAMGILFISGQLNFLTALFS